MSKLEEQKTTNSNAEEFKAGALAEFFSEFNPNASVYKSDNGFGFIVKDETTTTAFGTDQVSKQDEKLNLENYNTDDYLNDMNKMDEDFTQFIDDNQYDLKEQIYGMITENTKNILDNLAKYQDIKNERAKIQVIKVIGENKNE